MPTKTQSKSPTRLDQFEAGVYQWAIKANPDIYGCFPQSMSCNHCATPDTWPRSQISIRATPEVVEHSKKFRAKLQKYNKEVRSCPYAMHQGAVYRQVTTELPSGNNPDAKLAVKELEDRADKIRELTKKSDFDVKVTGNRAYHWELASQDQAEPYRQLAAVRRQLHIELKQLTAAWDQNKKDVLEAHKNTKHVPLTTKQKTEIRKAKQLLQSHGYQVYKN